MKHLQAASLGRLRFVVLVSSASAALALLASSSGVLGQETREILGFDFARDRTAAFEPLFFDRNGAAHDSRLVHDAVLGATAPGSLRLERTTPGQPASSVARTPCVPAGQSVEHHLRVAARQENPDAGCEVTYVVYASGDCAGEPFGGGPAYVGPVFPPFNYTYEVGVWQPLEVVVADFHGVGGVRYDLSLNGAGSCNYDDVVLIGIEPDSVPTVARWQLLMLAGLLVAGGVAILEVK